jgi:predicted Zn-dependent protease
MSSVSRTNASRLSHASGYLGLGMLNEASEELEAIDGDARLSDEVMVLRADLYMQAKQWDLLVAVARELARRDPEYEKGWIDWAYALREMNRVTEAKAVLLEAEPRHGKSGVFHYNLACYHSLLGESAEAKARLNRACKMGKEWKVAATTDPDLEALWGSFGAGE